MSPASTSWCHLLSFFLNERSAWSAQVIIRAFHDFRDSSIYDIIQSAIKVTQKRRKLCLQKQRWYSIERKSMPINSRHCCNSFVNTKVPTVMELMVVTLWNMICWNLKIYKTHVMFVCLQRWYSIEQKSMQINPRHHYTVVDLSTRPAPLIHFQKNVF